MKLLATLAHLGWAEALAGRGETDRAPTPRRHTRSSFRASTGTAQSKSALRRSSRPDQWRSGDDGL